MTDPSPIPDAARVKRLQRQRDRVAKRRAARMDAVVTGKVRRMSVAEFAVAEGLSPSTVYRLIAAGRLKTSRQLSLDKRGGKLMIELDR
jgi:hypothetical protein